MSLHRRAARRDENEPEIISALEQVGASVLPASLVDLIVGYCGVNYLLEVKILKGKLKPSQEKLLERWKGQYAIVRSPEEALRVIGAIT